VPNVYVRGLDIHRMWGPEPQWTESTT